MRRRWSIVCFAVCAAMRPMFFAGVDAFFFLIVFEESFKF